ncbi:Soluble aldose sugar dehydrogenase yliI [Yersinia bercovieri ATCC 43970]|uniref:Soluble aldose sugar dehydrogenase yliI n=1 Tax=Yersinia bercovieri ATCC 43970 TaxID=349968 RepID=A0ABP2E5M0_YERBE|nr:Soluble aldose sugar dehydrogenase yliI [Yersinia bercovieri ATCC 43970]
MHFYSSRASSAHIHDVRIGPDGYLYLLTNESGGKLLKISITVG